MVVAVDIGNSAIKLAFENNPTDVRRIEALSNDIDQDEELREATRFLGTERHSWHVCSVDQPQTRWLEGWIAQNRPEDHFEVISSDDIPLQSNVSDRDGLGRDRLLASWYGSVLSNGGPTIVVDAGTAVTIDVSADSVHLGGLIFPGSNTCLSALASQTDALPELLKKSPPRVSKEIQLGTGTEPAILLGVHQLQLFGIVAMVASIQQQHPGSIVFACGGSLSPMVSSLPDSWRHEKSFVTDAIFKLSKSV